MPTLSVLTKVQAVLGLKHISTMAFSWSWIFIFLLCEIQETLQIRVIWYSAEIYRKMADIIPFFTKLYYSKDQDFIKWYCNEQTNIVIYKLIFWIVLNLESPLGLAVVKWDVTWQLHSTITIPAIPLAVLKWELWIIKWMESQIKNIGVPQG